MLMFNLKVLLKPERQLLLSIKHTHKHFVAAVNSDSSHKMHRFNFFFFSYLPSKPRGVTMVTTEGSTEGNDTWANIYVVIP